MENTEILTYIPHKIKKYIGEDANLPIYSRHKRHVFVMTSMARPIYSRYGDELDMSPFMATLNTIIEKFITFFGGDKTRSKFQKIYHDKNDVIYMLYKKELYYFCKTSKDDSELLIYSMLDFLNIQIVSIVTNQVVNRLKTKPNYDFRNMLGGTTVNLGLAIKNGLQSPSIFLQSWMPVPMLTTNRALIHTIFKDFKHQEAFQCVLLLSHTHVFDVWYQKEFSLKSCDIILIQSLLQAQSSFRSSENWLPICLPGVSPEGFIYIFIAYLTSEAVVCMISDDNNSFQDCKMAFNQIQEKFKSQSINEQILVPAIKSCQPFKLPIDKSKSSSIQHFIVQIKEFNQFSMPVYNTFGKQDKQFKKYMNKYTKIYQKYISSDKDNQKEYLHFIKYKDFICGIYANQSYIIFFIFDYHCTIGDINTNLNLILKWIKEEEHRLFILKQN